MKGALTGNIRLKYFTQYNRGMVATSEIKKDSCIIYLPRDLMVTQHVAKENPIN